MIRFPIQVSYTKLFSINTCVQPQGYKRQRKVQVWLSSQPILKEKLNQRPWRGWWYLLSSYGVILFTPYSAMSNCTAFPVQFGSPATFQSLYNHARNPNRLPWTLCGSRLQTRGFCPQLRGLHHKKSTAWDIQSSAQHAPPTSPYLGQMALFLRHVANIGSEPYSKIHPVSWSIRFIGEIGVPTKQCSECSVEMT